MLTIIISRFIYLQIVNPTNIEMQKGNISFIRAATNLEL